MKIHIPLKTLYENPFLKSHLMRPQARTEFERIVNEFGTESIDKIERFCENASMSFGDLEEILYNEKYEYIVSYFGLSER